MSMKCQVFLCYNKNKGENLKSCVTEKFNDPQGKCSLQRPFCYNIVLEIISCKLHSFTYIFLLRTLMRQNDPCPLGFICSYGFSSPDKVRIFLPLCR